MGLITLPNFIFLVFGIVFGAIAVSTVLLAWFANRLIDNASSEERLQALYDSEINFKISTFYDAGFDVCLGDDSNGFTDKANWDTYAGAVKWLEQQAKFRHPSSDFAKRFK